MLKFAAVSASVSVPCLLPWQHADGIEPNPNAFAPKADEFQLWVDFIGGTLTKQLDVLTNDTTGLPPGTELQIMSLDTSAPLVGTPSISSDKKFIIYT